MSFILKKLESVVDSAEKKEEFMLAKEKELDAQSLGNAIMKETSHETILSSDATFKGSISFKSFLRIDGRFEGEINSTGTLFVGKTGQVKAEIKVGNIIVEGKIHGNIQASEKVDLRESAQLFGDIKANKLVIAEGVSFVGNCNVNPNNEKVEGAFGSKDSKPSEIPSEKKPDIKDFKNPVK